MVCSRPSSSANGCCISRSARLTSRILYTIRRHELRAADRRDRSHRSGDRRRPRGARVRRDDPALGQPRGARGRASAAPARRCVQRRRAARGPRRRDVRRRDRQLRPVARRSPTCCTAAPDGSSRSAGCRCTEGFFDPTVHDPPGLPVPMREDAELATEADDGKSYRIGRTEQLLFDTHPTATHFRYPYVYGPRQLAPREWCVVRRILERPAVPDAARRRAEPHPFRLRRQPRARCCSRSTSPRRRWVEVFNCGDDEKLTIRQVVEIITDELAHDWELVSMPAHVAIPASPLMMNYRPNHRVIDTASSASAWGIATSCRGARRRSSGHAVARGTHRTLAATRSCVAGPVRLRGRGCARSWWRSAIAEPPDLGYAELPGYGKSYAGPGTRNVRADTRI